MGLRQVHFLFGAPVLTYTIPRAVVDPGRLVKPMTMADARRRRVDAPGGRASDEVVGREALCRTPAIRELLVYLDEQLLPSACEALGYHPERCRLSIAEMFGQVDHPGEPKSPPVHRHSRLSGLYSVQVPDRGGDLVFHRDGLSRQATYVDPRMIRAPTEANQPSWRVSAAAGRLVLFPGYVSPTLQPNLSSELRISVGFTTALVRTPT